MIWPVARVSWPADPMQEFSRLYRDMDHLFGEFEGRETFPAVNVWSDENEAMVSVELPGVDPKDVTVSMNENILTIQGERKAETLGEGDIQVRRERPDGRFTRSFRMPFEVEGEKIAARYEHGLLSIRLPRREATKPRKIDIAVA